MLLSDMQESLIEPLALFLHQELLREMLDHLRKQYQADDDEDDTSEDDADLDEDEESDDDEDQSLDILSAKVEVDGVEMTVEEIKAGYLRQRDYTRKTQEISESRKQLEAFNAELSRERAQYEQLLPMLEQKLQDRNEVVAELLQEHVALKKELGEL